MNTVDDWSDWLSAQPAEDAVQLRRTLILVGAALLASIALLYVALADWVVVAVFAAITLSLAGLMLLFRRTARAEAETAAAAPDWTVTHAASDHPSIAIALTDDTGRLVCANNRFIDLFGSDTPPPKLPLDSAGATKLVEAGRAAWRDGGSAATGLLVGDAVFDADLACIGRGGEYLLWRFVPVVHADPVAEAVAMLSGKPGQILGRSGVMVATIGPEGRIRSANSAFVQRALGTVDGSVVGREFASCLRADERNFIYFEREGRKGSPIRLLHVPLVDPDGQPPEDERTPALIIMIDKESATLDRGSVLANVQALLGLLPIGLAMVDRDGRFLFANEAFVRAGGLAQDELPPYPSDLVVSEDKGALADAVRRHASGQASASDVTVRLRSQPDEPIALSIANVRGMGEAAVLLSMKDSSEESRLKRQVAQASKMQAVGQLAGGVAHDFNNVLTAIIGHCDLMLMRHNPGDSDYDDIQQIKNNSNRAAQLTGQLLAFSRQQTLRPQVLQLPDIVSEVSNLLRRLLGEKITLEVHHDRNLGPVRADPGQLEQVIMNLAINARDAMLVSSRGGGTLTIRTKRLFVVEVHAMANEILPPDDYSVLTVEDDGVGMAAEIQAKIFEPFFTTKDVGKGTGLGLSTVYGIVKQSGGFIFVDSTVGKGTVFSIYLPVYKGGASEVQERRKAVVATPPEQWGNARILLVEDEDMVRAVAERALTRQGHSVVTASDGEEGLARLADSGPFDLVVSDVVMPNMDGPKMAAELRKRAPDLPILFMSGYAEEQLRQNISFDQVHFLPKPFSVAQIIEAVQLALVQ